MRRMKVESAFIDQAAEDAKRLDADLGVGVTVQKPPPVIFESANAAKKIAPSPGVAFIVATVFVPHEEIIPTYKLLTERLSSGAKRVEHAYLLKDLDEADGMAFLARRLYATVRLERDVWERKNEVRFAAIRQEAHRSLQVEKDRKERSKQITDKDVDTECASIAPDEWQSLEKDRSEMKHMEDAVLGLVEAWASRARSLQTMFGKSR